MFCDLHCLISGRDTDNHKRKTIDEAEYANMPN